MSAMVFKKISTKIFRSPFVATKMICAEVFQLKFFLIQCCQLYVIIHSLGFACEEHENPADYFLDVISVCETQSSALVAYENPSEFVQHESFSYFMVNFKQH